MIGILVQKVLHNEGVCIVGGVKAELLELGSERGGKSSEDIVVTNGLQAVEAEFKVANVVEIIGRVERNLLHSQDVYRIRQNPNVGISCAG